MISPAPFVFPHLRAFLIGCASVAGVICIGMFNKARQDPDSRQFDQALLYVLGTAWILFLLSPLILIGGVIGILIDRFVIR